MDRSQDASSNSGGGSKTKTKRCSAMGMLPIKDETNEMREKNAAQSENNLNEMNVTSYCTNKTEMKVKMKKGDCWDENKFLGKESHTKVLHK